MVYIRLGETHNTLVQMTKENAVPPLYIVFILAFLSNHLFMGSMAPSVHGTNLKFLEKVCKKADKAQNTTCVLI